MGVSTEKRSGVCELLLKLKLNKCLVIMMPIDRKTWTFCIIIIIIT